MHTKPTYLLALLSIVLTPILSATEFLTPQQIKDILATESKSQTTISSPKNVLFCWSKPDHPKHVHAYERFAKSYAAQISEIENVHASAIEGYPTAEQWQSADLVVFNLTIKTLSDEQYATMDAHLDQGGSVIVVHQGLVQRQGYDQWAERIGLAFSWDAPPTRSKWGKGDLKIRLDTKHPIFKGFPDTIHVTDELYWNLQSGNKGEITLLGETTAPTNSKRAAAAEPDTNKWPAFWTVEHAAKDEAKPGRVFCCVISHPNEIAFSSSFQIVMMRAFAWCLDESAGAFLKASK